MIGALSLVISLYIVELIPRNVILGVGMWAVAVPVAVEAAMTARFLHTSNKGGLAAGVAMLYIYIFTYGVFLDGPGYFYVSPFNHLPTCN